MADVFARQVIEFVPKLSAAAKRFTQIQSAAQDLVQETVLRALIHSDQFKPGTSLEAWLKVILRNCFLDERRKATRMKYVDPASDNRPAIYPPQEWQVWYQEVRQQFGNLPAERRVALTLVAMEGKSYEQAATKMRCSVGTIRSRVSRARVQLHEMVHMAADERSIKICEARGARQL